MNKKLIFRLLSECRSDVFDIAESLEPDEALQAEFEVINNVYEKLNVIAELVGESNGPSKKC